MGSDRARVPRVVPPLRGSELVLCAAFLGLTGLLRKALYVSPLGYAVMFCFLATQGVALGSAMKPLRGMHDDEGSSVFFNKP